MEDHVKKEGSDVKEFSSWLVLKKTGEESETSTKSVVAGNYSPRVDHENGTLSLRIPGHVHTQAGTVASDCSTDLNDSPQSEGTDQVSRHRLASFDKLCFVPVERVGQ